MSGGLKTKYKIVGAGLAVIGLLLGAKCASDAGFIPKVAGMKAFVPQKVELAQADLVAGAPRVSYELPVEPASSFTGCTKVGLLPWNAESALTVANGGVQTGKTSLVRKYSGGCLSLENQGDYSVMQQNMLAFAQARSNGDQNPAQGYGMVMIMGDALSSFMEGVQPQLAKLNQSAEVIGVIGFSHGEDKCMGRPLGGDPQKARGSLIAAVPRDGDQNTCQKFASDNSIPVNVDQTTYDPTAINYLDTSSFIEAGQKYLAKTCVDRLEVKGGIKTGKTVHVCVDGVATWTPGDVTVAKAIADEQKNGGTRAISTWASTADYNQQMPAVIIANKQWADQNRAFVVGVLRATDRAAFAIRTTQDGMSQLGEANANVFGQGGDESKPSYWTGYFVGSDFTDNQGNKNHLGGSRVITLAEARDFLGQGQGTLNIYKGVYTTFGDLYHAFYPKDVPSYPRYESVVDPSFTMAALAGSSTVANTSQKFETGTIANTVSQKAFPVYFDTGKATIRAESQDTLFKIADQAGMTGLRIRIDGHTDSTGDPEKNVALSRERAQAVADWLHSQAPSTFPVERMSVRGYGDTKPVCTEDKSSKCLAQNRRVEIILGN